MYILINQDIKIRKGKLAGQVGHAVASFLYGYVLTNGVEALANYMENDQKKIILKCSQSKLETLESEGFVSIRDKGYTALEPNTLTCVNLGILDEESTPAWVKELKLL